MESEVVIKEEKGSIFVCFMCETEFCHVSELNEHMEEHGDLPEIDENFKPRKRKKEKVITKVSKPFRVKQEEPIVKKSTAAYSYPAVRVTKPLPTQQPQLPKVQPRKIITPEERALQRAMRIKQYIVSKEKNSEEVKEPDNGENMQESIMMIDSSYFDSFSSNPPTGPTIMNSEPEGFVCPTPKNVKKESHTEKMFKQKYQQNYFNDDADIDDNSDSNSINGTKGFISLKADSKSKKKGNRRYEEVTSFVNLDHQDQDTVKRPGRRSRPREEEDESESGFQCLECLKKFRSMTTMKVHMKSHMEKKEIHCPYCDDVFPQRYILYEHLISDHEESSNLTCPVCYKIFTRPDSLKSHMVRMHEENGGLNCVECGKNFPSQAQLEIHVRVHTGERPFKCEVCSKGFVQKVHLRTHLRTMHNLTDMPTTPCRLCSKMFDGRLSLREHYTTAHKLNSAQYRAKVNDLKREGFCVPSTPPRVRVVDPSFHYQKITITEQPSQTRSSDANDRVIKRTKKMKRLAALADKRDKKRPLGMGTIMNTDDDLMMSPGSFSFHDSQPKGRDQEELNLVESAFKVAEEMDQLNENNSAILVSGEDSSIYYTLPLVLDPAGSGSGSKSTEGSGSTDTGTMDTIDACQLSSIGLADDDYAQFAADHAQLTAAEDGGLQEDEEEIDLSGVAGARCLKDGEEMADASKNIDILTM